MSQNDAADSTEPSAGAVVREVRKGGAPIVAVLALLLAGGGYYLLYVRRNTDYLIARNHRLLATMGRQAGEAFETERKVMGTLQTLDDARLQPMLRKFKEEYGLKLSDASRCVNDRERDELKGGHQELISSNLETVAGDGYRLSFLLAGTPCGGVELKELLEPIFAAREAFANVLLANEKGEVVYQQPALGIHHLDQLRIPGRTALPKGDKTEGAGLAAVARGLTGTTHQLDGELSGRAFKIFVQTVRLPLAGAAAGPPPARQAASPREEGRREYWLIGLVPGDTLSKERLAVPPSYLASAVIVLLLCLLSWPILKLVLLEERQRVRRVELVMVFLCSLLGISLLTLLLLDVEHHWELERLMDRQTAAFARGVATNLEREIRHAYDQLETLEAAVAVTAPGEPVAAERADLLTGPRELVAVYPFFDSFALVDGDGRRGLKWTTDHDILPSPSSLQARGYFRRAVSGDLWPVPVLHSRSLAGSRRCDPAETAVRSDARGEAGGCFTLDSISSMVSGMRQGVLAKPVAARLRGSTEVAGFEIAILTLPMLSVIHPVVPPGFHFAVIDPTGQVLFHSDTARNLAENLFDETDQDRRLQSAVFARHEATLDVRYWGKDFKASVAPVEGPPWTVVALQAKGPIEAANLATVLTAVVFLMLFIGLFAAGPTLVTLMRPAYHAEWLWPAPRRSNDYLRLCLVYLLLAMAFVPAAVFLPGSDWLVGIACLLALLALVLGYLQLTQHRRRRPARVAWGAGLVLLCLGLGWLLALADPDAHLLGVTSWLLPAVNLAPVLAACFLVAFRPRWRTHCHGLSLPWAYPMLGVLLMLLAAVLPTTCVFKLAQRIQTECYVKHGQLELADSLRQHRARLARLYRDEWGRGKTGLAAKPPLLMLNSRQPKPFGASDCGRLGPAIPAARAGDCPLDYYGQYFFDTRLTALAPDEGNDTGHDHGREEEVLRDFLQDLLPTYSAGSAETRELLHDRAADGGWHWHRHGGRLELERPDLGLSLANMPPRTSLSGAVPEGAAAAEEAPPPAAPFTLAAVAAGWGAYSLETRLAAAIAAIAAALLPLLPLLPLLVGLAWFLSRRVFLVDLFEPLWSGREGQLPATVGSNVFLISGRREWHVRNRWRSFICLRCKDLEDDTANWPKRRLELLRALPARNILVEGFEYGILEPAFNDRKLALLEELVAKRAVVVLSTVSPALLLGRPEGGAASAPERAPGSEDRWRALLASFTVIDEDARARTAEAGLADVSVRAWRELRELLRRGRCRRRRTPAARQRLRSALLAEECGDDPFLGKIGSELDRFVLGLDRRQLLEEFGERAEVYYRSLWATCCPDERLVLGHLAEDRLVNEKDRRVVRRLMARGLIRREPVFRVMNETFRRFLVSPARRSEMVILEHLAEKAAGPSAWDLFRRPFFGALAASIVFFFATQKELLEGGVAIATAVTAGLPVVMKALDLLSGRRAGVALK